MIKETVSWCKPTRATRYSAYVDLYAKEDIIIGAGCTSIVNLGVKIDLALIDREKLGINACKNDIVCMQIWEKFLRSHYLEVALRSSLAVKGLIIANGIGVIDLDFPDEIGLIVHNPVKAINISLDDWASTYALDGRPFHIKKGDKVAQCTLKKHKGYLLGYESDVIRKGGFGSTGK